jgi:hypothetical protein
MTNPATGVAVRRCLIVSSMLLAVTAIPAQAYQLTFTSGDLVISTVSNSTSGSDANALDTAAPIVLDQFQLGTGGTSITAAGTLELPQIGSGNNSSISGEFGSASEGFLTQSVTGQYLTILGYGVNANTFNSAPVTTYGTAALGQTTSLTAANQTGTPVTTVARVVGLIGANGSVDTSSALTGVFNTNNPRSVVTVDGSSFYVSGQGAKGDTTQGVFYATLGATTATAIDDSTDTRALAIVNNGSGNTLYVSRDFNPPNGGTQNFTNVSSLTNAAGGLPTSAAGLITTHITPPASPLSLGGNNGSINVTDGTKGTVNTENGINNSRDGSFVYLSPEQYFFASPSVLYVTDSGQPKNGNANKAALGEGGLQKWVLTGTGANAVWTLDYDLVSGLNLVNNASANSATPTAAGVTGLFGLTGKVVAGQVELFATSYGLNELSPSFLYEITDNLSDTSISQASSEKFITLDTSTSDTSFRGVAFAPSDTTPVPAPATLLTLLGGLAALGAFTARRRPGAAVAACYAS